MNDNINIQNLLVDMAKYSPVKVYIKYGIGIQTQLKIKEAVVFKILKNKRK